MPVCEFQLPNHRDQSSTITTVTTGRPVFYVMKQTVSNHVRVKLNVAKDRPSSKILQLYFLSSLTIVFALQDWTVSYSSDRFIVIVVRAHISGLQSEYIATAESISLSHSLCPILFIWYNSRDTPIHGKIKGAKVHNWFQVVRCIVSTHVAFDFEVDHLSR